MSTRPDPRELIVLRRDRITPSLQRVTLGGPGLEGFPAGQQGGYLKLFLGEDARGKPIVRTYTIRDQREDELDIDFALHGDDAAGPATKWSLSAEPGETIKVGGPGAAKPLPEAHDFYLIAGDMTALPAISVNLVALSNDARGVAVIEIQNDADQVELDKPEGIEVRWLVNREPGSQPALLSDELRRIALPQGKLAGWAACEFSAMRNLRALLRDELGLRGDSLYISSYWKAGLIEDEHKRVKREDAETQTV
ncbi:siderophore-interacting protein [Citromicrobium bathyomarinum]|uniref:siderophore-interacting protein n=1 Tax=Citromicrobium bathyomarinum TaxID=72174 RepID=UPI001E42E9B9|nr:siderophore-interacting protein [Citromicrobium bathyomarinum]MCD1622056.1 siderophore-interacting protein [Citromicrobium bathyomarinum]